MSSQQTLIGSEAPGQEFFQQEKQFSQLKNQDIYQPVLRYYEDIPKCYSITNSILNMTVSRWNVTAQTYECNQPGYYPLVDDTLKKKHLDENSTHIDNTTIKPQNQTKPVQNQTTPVPTPLPQPTPTPKPTPPPSPVQPQKKPQPSKNSTQQHKSDNIRNQDQVIQSQSYFSDKQLFFGLIGIVIVFILLIYACRNISRLCKQSEKSKHLQQQSEITDHHPVQNSNLEPKSTDQSYAASEIVEIELHHSENEQESSSHFNKENKK